MWDMDIFKREVVIFRHQSFYSIPPYPDMHSVDSQESERSQANTHTHTHTHTYTGYGQIIWLHTDAAKQVPYFLQAGTRVIAKCWSYVKLTAIMFAFLFMVCFWVVSPEIFLSSKDGFVCGGCSLWRSCWCRSPLEHNTSLAKGILVYSA